MQGNFDYQAAIKAGHKPEDVTAFLKQNPQLTPVGMSAMPTTQADTGQISNYGQNLFTKLSPPPQSNVQHPLLDFLLPTAGAVAGGIAGGFVPVLGETGVSEVGGAALGQAGGQALANVLSGRPVGQDVVKNAEQGAVGGVFGLGAGKILGPVLGKLGGKALGMADNLTGKLTPDVFNKVVDDSPWFMANKAGLTKTAAELGLLDGTAEQGLNKMLTIMPDIHGQIEGAISKNPTLAPITDAATGKSSLVDNFGKYLENAGSAEEDLKNPTIKTLNKFGALGNGSQAGMQDIYQLKQELGSQLGNVFKKIAKGNPLSPKEEVNLAAWNAAKDTMDQYGSPEIRALNNTQNDLYNIATAYVKDYTKRAGTPPPSFKFSDLFPAGMGAVGAHFAGVSPLLAVGGLGAAEVVSKNPGILYKAGNASSKLANILGNKAITVGTGATINNVLRSGLGVGRQQNSNQDINNHGPNEPHNTLSFLDHTISNTYNNVNSQDGIKSTDGQTVFPKTLPNPSQISNTIPGQPYSQEKYIADVQTIQSDMQRAAGNPVAQKTLSNELSTIQAKKAANDDYVKQYVSQNGLDAGGQDFIRGANPQWNSLTQLHQLLQDKGTQNIFSSFIQQNPAVQAELAARDPKYALMFNLLGQQKLAQARIAQGGVPRAYDLELSKLGTGQTGAANLEILDFAMKQFLSQYSQYAPLYGLTLQTQQGETNPSTQSSFTGHSGLDQILQAGQ